MKPWRHRLRRAWFFLGALIAAGLIAAAVAVGLLQLGLPLVAHYPDKLAGFLSQRLHRPVHFDSVQSQWQPSGPLLIVHGLTLGPGYAGGESLTLRRAAIKFDFSAWLRPAHRWVTLRLTGLELRMRHDASGWRVLGLGNPNQTQQQAPLQSLPVDLDLRNLTVSIDDVQARRTYVMSSPRLRVVSIGNTLRFGGNIARKGSPQPVTVIGRFVPSKQDADLYVTGRALDLAGMVRGVNLHGFELRGGRGDLELWGSWRGNAVRSVAARFDLHDLALGAAGGRHAEASALAGVVRLERGADGWELRYRNAGQSGDDIDDVGGLILRMHGTGNSRRIVMAARDLDLTPLLPFLGLLPQAPAGMSDWIATAHPHAQVRAAALRWDANGRYAIVAHLHALGAKAQGKAPGVDALDGTLRGDSESLSFEIPKQAVTLDYPAVFRQPFAFKTFGGTLVAWRENGLWHVATDRLEFDNDQFGGEGRALVILPPGHKPFIDAYAMVTHAQVPGARLFLPVSMPASTIAWLDRGLVAGKVDAGLVAMRGSLDDWPFVDHKGRFDALGRVSGAVLDYGDEWPRADHIDATAEFLDNQMIIEATHAETAGNTVTHAIATIPDLGHGELNLAAEGQGSGAALLGFVKRSPVGKDAAATLSNLNLSGDGKIAFTLVLPFGKPESFALDGNLQLSHGAVVAKQWNFSMQAINGLLHFDQKGFHADNLTARWHGAPANLSIALGGDTVDPAYQLQAVLSGAFSPASMLQDYADLAPLAKIAQGAANFRIGFTIAAGGKPEDAPKKLSVQSDMRGIALLLPAPLDKPASAALPMSLQLGLPIPGAEIDLRLGDLVRARGHLPDANAHKPAALGVMFGGTQPEIPANGMVVNGHAPTLDLGGWAQLAAGEGASTNPQANTAAAAAVNGLPTLTSARLTTAQALAFGTRLGALSLRFANNPDAEVISFDGASLAGTLTLPTRNLAQRGISAELQRLYWPEVPASPAKSPATAAPAPATTAAPAAASSSMNAIAAATSTAPAASATTAAAQPSAPPATPDALSGIAPASLPPLHLSVADLRLGDAKLGETHLETAPVAYGMHIARMDTQSKSMQIHAQGNWLGTAQASHSQMAIDIRSDSLSRMLEAFNFGGLVAGGKNTHVVIDGSWPGAPTAFALANFEGTLKFSIGEGRILEVKPGVGRLFGLFSIADLPRRLTLDFGDVFRSGFGFNSVSGDFTIRNGNAYTDDVEIKGPAADIRIRGRTGLRTHDYDQIVDASPHTSGALAVVGAVVGGPIGAAAGLAISKGLNQAAHARYSITGGWTHPVITTISKTVPKAPAQPAPAQSGASPPASASSSAKPPAAASSTAPAAASNAAPPAPASSKAEPRASKPAPSTSTRPAAHSSPPASGSSSAPTAPAVIPAKAGTR